MTNQTEQGAALARLLDDDGENRAVRSFLLAYGAGCHKIGDMVSHMELSGWNDHPEFVAFKSLHNEHLTKAEAQDWLRHLFALEAPAVSTLEGYTSVPAGYALVPLEPTQAMLDAVAPFPAHLRAEHPDPADPWHEAMRIATATDQAVVASTWRAMVAATPGDSHA